MNNDEADIRTVLDGLKARSLRVPFAAGAYRTSIPFLSVLKEPRPTQLTHAVLKPSFCVVLQGTKKLHIGHRTLQYGAGNYLAASIDMPVNGQVTEAQPDSPYLALRIELAPEEVATVALEAGLDFRQEEGPETGAFVGRADVGVLEPFERLLRLTEDGRAAGYLAPFVKREIVYRMLAGPEGAIFYQNMLLHREAAGISRLINWITAHFDSSVTIGEMADMGNMSVSNLHRKFKAVTMMAPLQYQKRLRLQEARRLLLEGAINVTEAALRVGYQSPTQFIREYKRLFGLSPLRDVQAIRGGSGEQSGFAGKPPKDRPIEPERTTIT